jgi:hypothetical protein
MGAHNILQLFLWQALEGSEISSQIIIKPIKPPTEPLIFSRWVPIKFFLKILWTCNISELFSHSYRGTARYPQ